MNPIGIYFAYWEQEWKGDYLAYVYKVKRLGFDCLELGAGALPDMTAAQRRAVAQAARREGIQLSYCIGLPPQYDVSSPDEDVRRAGVRYVEGLLDCIGGMGGGVLGGILYACWPAAEMSWERKAIMREKALQSVRQLAHRAQEQGVTYCLEVVNRFEQCLLNTAEEGRAFVDEVGHPAVKLLLDSFHMNVEEDHIGDAIRASKGYIGHFHIGECNRKPPGLGHMPWEEILTALADIGYDGSVVMEPFVRPGGGVGQDIRVFRDLSGGADEAGLDAMAEEALAFIRSTGRRAAGKSGT